MVIKIGSRQSDLARLQAYSVRDALQKKFPNIQVQFSFRESLGDQNQNDPLWKMPEKGVFTEDFLKGLLSGEYDCVVHSWKDLPTEKRNETEIIATLPRADQRDILLFKKEHLHVVRDFQEMHVFSSSPRREYNLTPFLKEYLPFPLRDVKFRSVRGNILTRVKKLLETREVDALIVAKAALDRLLLATEPDLQENKQILSQYLNQCEFMVLPLSQNPTAAAQGAIAIEIRQDRQDLKEIFRELNCADTFDGVVLERKTLSGYGGGCHQKIGVSLQKKQYGVVEFLKGLTDQGEILNRSHVRHYTKIPQAQSPEHIWPINTQAQNLFFERKEIFGEEQKERIRKAPAIYVARMNAVVESNLLLNKYVWTSGLKTWKSLAEKGIWVHGTSDSLGEVIPDLEALVPGLHWHKLSHEDSSFGMPTIATYQLVAKSVTPDLSQKTHFFWMSGSQFKLALERFPQIAQGIHACGPGNTYLQIEEALKNQSEKKVHIYLDYDHWKKDVLS